MLGLSYSNHNWTFRIRLTVVSADVSGNGTTLPFSSYLNTFTVMTFGMCFDGVIMMLVCWMVSTPLSGKER